MMARGVTQALVVWLARRVADGELPRARAEAFLADIDAGRLSEAQVRAAVNGQPVADVAILELEADEALAGGR